MYFMIQGQIYTESYYILFPEKKKEEETSKKILYNDLKEYLAMLRTWILLYGSSG
jgi:hypothetical protein